jgi:hypothetical protein
MQPFLSPHQRQLSDDPSQARDRLLTVVLTVVFVLALAGVGAWLAMVVKALAVLDPAAGAPSG